MSCVWNSIRHGFCANSSCGGKESTVWGIIATWRMALEGVSAASKMLAKKEQSGDAIEMAIREVDDFPYY